MNLDKSTQTVVDEINILHKPSKLDGKYMPLLECVRRFPLIQQFPSTIKELNSKSWPKLNITQLPTTPIATKDDKNDKNTFNSLSYIPCKKLRIMSPNGKDLGEFNVKAIDKNTSKGQVYTITKSDTFKPISKSMMLTLNPVTKKMLPRILKQPYMDIRNKMIKIEENMSIKSEEIDLMEHIMFNKSDQIIDISIKELQTYNEINNDEVKNSDNNMLTSGHEKNQKSSLDCTVDDNSQKYPEVNHKLTTSIESIECTANNINTSGHEKNQKSSLDCTVDNSKKYPKVKHEVTTSTKSIQCTANDINISLKIDAINAISPLENNEVSSTKEDLIYKEIAPLKNNKVFSTEKDLTYKEIAESPFPKVSCKRLVIPNHVRIHKRKYVSTPKTTKDKKVNRPSKILNCVRAHKEEEIGPNKKDNTKIDSRNTVKSEQVGTLRKENNSFQINSKLMHETKQIDEIKTRNDIMTIVPNKNNLPFDKNAVSGLEHELRSTIGVFDADFPSNEQSEHCHENNLVQEMSNQQWNITKYVNSIIKDNLNDDKLRTKALKALSDCDIDVRHIRNCLSKEVKSVHDAQVQTSVFGLLDPKFFVLINKDIENIQRIQQITLHDTFQKTQDLQNNSLHKTQNFQNNLVSDIIQQPSTSKNFDMIEESDFDIDSFMNQICEENLGAFQVKETLTAMNLKYQKIIDQLQKDFELVKKYDENGLLNIHNAVLKNNIFDVQRYLMVLEQCKKNIDIMTMDGMTSLELAIRYNVHSDIVKFLLQSGAQPVKTQLHESALIIAAKQSSGLLPMLVTYVSDPKLLDQFDSEGFAALHYCSRHSDVEGVSALVSAGANVDLKDMKSGRTPLFHALESDNTDERDKVVKILLRAEAITKITNFAGQPPLSLANNENKSTFTMSLRKSTKTSSLKRYLY